MKEQIAMSLEVKSIIRMGEEEETYVETSQGQLRISSGVNSLTYTEEVGGKRVYTTLTYRLGATRVHFKKRVGVKSELVFEEGLEYTGVYEVSPYAFDMTVRSHKVRGNLGEEGGEILLAYTRILGGDTAEVTLHITGVPLGEEDL